MALQWSRENLEWLEAAFEEQKEAQLFLHYYFFKQHMPGFLTFFETDVVRYEPTFPFTPKCIPQTLLSLLPFSRF